MGKYKKYIGIFLGLIIAIFIGKVLYAFTYVGDRTVLYPKDEYSASELIANKILGYKTPYTIEELKEKNLIFEDRYVISKTKTEIKWSESKLESNASKEIKEAFKESEKQHKKEIENTTLNLYMDLRADYLSAEDGAYKENLKAVLKKQMEQNKFLIDWEKSQADCILEELNK